MENYLDIDFMDSKAFIISDKDRIINLIAAVKAGAAKQVINEKGMIIATNQYDKDDVQIIYAIPAEFLEKYHILWQ